MGHRGKVKTEPGSSAYVLLSDYGGEHNSVEVGQVCQTAVSSGKLNSPIGPEGVTHIYAIGPSR